MNTNSTIPKKLSKTNQYKACESFAKGICTCQCGCGDFKGSFNGTYVSAEYSGVIVLNANPLVCPGIIIN